MRLSGLLIFAALLVAPALSRADDWSVKRSDFDPRVVARFKGMLARNATDGYALSRLTKLYSKHRSLKALIREYNRLAKASPKNAGPRYILGRLNAKVSRWADAAVHFRAAADMLPRSDWPLAGLASALEKQGKTKEAITAYLKASRLTRSTARKKRYLGALVQLCSTAGDHKAVAEHLRSLILLAPRDRRHQLELSRTLARAGKPKEALAQLEKLLARTGDAARKVELLKEMGKLEAALKNSGRAVKLFRKAMSLTSRGHWLRRELTDEIIDIYRKRESLAELIQDYEKRWKRRGSFEHETLGRLHDETGDEEKALAAYRASLKLGPHQVRIRLRVIALLERSGRAEEVIKEYRRLTMVAPGEPRYQIELARRIYADNKPREAIKLLDRIRGRFPADASVQSVLADLFARWGDQKRALTCSRSLVRIEPKDPAHLINLGEQYYLEGKKKKAMRIWARLMRVVPGRHAALAKLAEVYAQHNLTDKAISLYKQAIKLKPKVAAYHRSIALLWEIKRQTSSAIAAWERVRTLGRAQGGTAGKQAEREARAHLIKVMKRTYQLRRMVRRLGKKLDLGTLSDSDSMLLAEGLVRMESPSVAARVYRKILAKDQSNVEVLLALEKIYRRQRKLEEAVEVLKQLSRVQPTSAREYYQRIADLLLQLYRDKEALEYAHKAVAMANRNAPSFERLGRLLEKKEDYKGAAEAYRKAIKLDANHIQAYFALARLISRSGKPQQADALYRQIIKRAGDPEQVRRAFRQGITIASYAGTLELLERVLLPRALGGLNRNVYRELLVRVYRRSVPPLIHLARHGTSAARLSALAKLDRIGKRGLAPLLEELSAEQGSREDLVQILGYLGNPNAVLSLLRIASEKQEEIFYIQGTAPRSLHKIFLRRSGRSYRSLSRSSRRANLRVAATVAAGRIGGGRAVPKLLTLLGSQEGPMRDAAAWSLARASRGGDPAVAKALFNALGDGRIAVQAMACAGLGAARVRSMRPVLEEVMADENRAAEVRAACAWGLGAMGDPDALPQLAQLLRSGDGIHHRNAAHAMGAMGDKRAIASLLEAFWLRRARVRQAILWSLNRLTTPANSPPEQPFIPDISLHDGRVDLKDFIRLLTRDADPGAGGPPLPPKVLAALLLKENSPGLAKGLLSALERHRDVVLRVLSDLDGSPAELTLAPFTDGAAELPAAERASLRKSVRRACAPLEAQLIKLSRHDEDRVRARALRVLAKLSPVRACSGPLLEEALGNPARAVGVAALDAIQLCQRRGTIRTGKAAKYASEALAKGNRHQRERAARLLADLIRAGGVSKGHQVQISRAAMGDLDGFVRLAAVEGLAAASGSRFRDILYRALSDEVPQVRAAACLALGRRGDRAAAPALSKKKDDPDPATRQTCRSALELLR